MFMQVVARSGVSARHSFVKALLHVWCETERTAMLMQREYAGRWGRKLWETFSCAHDAKVEIE